LNSSLQLTNDSHYLLLKEEVVRTTGLVYFEDRDSEFRDKVYKRIAHLGMPDCGSYLAYLNQPGKNGSEELDRLISDLTIGETYFFRGMDQFDALKDTIIPNIIEKNAAEKRIRIWSAGCATGAEPYSIAILLDQYFQDRLSSWEISIFGTDINRRFLSQAVDGVFEEWAFRGTGPDLRTRYFSQEGLRWRLSSQIKSKVCLQYHNLLKHPFPSLFSSLEAIDLIICRNVLIYFDSTTIRTVIRHFQETLRPGGWLILGHAEQMGPIPHLESVPVNHLIFFFKKEPSPPAIPPVHVHAHVPPSEEFDISRVRGAADRGSFSEAILYCQQFLAKNSMNALGHFYYGLILDQIGQSDDSIKELQQSVELDPKFILPCHYLGMIYRRRKEPELARYWFVRGQTLLEGIAEDMEFEHADGLKAGELRNLIQANLEITSGGES
jgi:chemotaxis protein methyltransferase CheR